MLDLILTCDLGTTSCKVVLFTLDGSIKCQVNKEYKTYYPNVGWAEQDAYEWWNTCASSIRKCIEKVGCPCRILCVSLSSQRETFVAVDSKGLPLSKAICWLDKRNVKQTDEISRYFGKDYIHNTTGMIPYPNFTSTKILWMKQNTPEILKNTYKILQPRDYIYYRLTGKYITDYSLASRTMMFDRKNKKWCSNILKYIGIDESKMPDIFNSYEKPGKITVESSMQTGIKDGTPVVIGGGDRCLEALGSGIHGNSVMESTATAGNISYVTDKNVDSLDEKIVCTFHVLKDKYLMEQGMTTTGSILRWFRDNIYFSKDDKRNKLDYSEIDNEISKSPIGSNKLILLPFFMGARSTRFNPHAKGVLFGLDLSHKRGDIGRSIMEGVAFEVKACIDTLSKMGMDVYDVYLMGGGSKADIWNSIKADVYNKIVKVPRITEAGSLGAFALGGYSIGLFSNPEDEIAKINNIVKEFKPDAKNNKLYMQYYDIYNDLYNSVENLFERLDNI